MGFEIITFAIGILLALVGIAGPPNALGETPNNASILFIIGISLIALTFLK